MDRPVDGTIYESNHLQELVDVHSKLIIDLAKVPKPIAILTQVFSNDELNAFMVN